MCTILGAVVGVAPPLPLTPTWESPNKGGLAVSKLQVASGQARP